MNRKFAEKKLNVIFLGGFTYPSGMAGTKRIQNFINSFVERKIDVKVMTIGNVSEFKSDNKPAGHFKGVEYKNAGASLSSSLAFYFFYPFILINIFYTLSKWKSGTGKNILYAYNSITVENFLVLLYSKITGYKILLDIVEDYKFSLENNSFLHSLKLKSTIFFEKHVSFFGHCVIVLSTYLKKAMEGASKEKIAVYLIPCSCEINNEFKPKDKFNTPVKICYSGSFGNKDGLNTLISAFDEFSKKFPHSRLLFSGYGSKSDDVLKKIVNEKISYAGYLSNDEYQKFINDADILCMTRVDSQYANAGFPFKLGEYLATGNPVIATNVSDVLIYLTNEKDCMIVEPENVRELCEAMEFYVTNPQKAFSIGRCGYENAKRNFNNEINSEKLLEIIHEI